MALMSASSSLAFAVDFFSTAKARIISIGIRPPILKFWNDNQVFEKSVEARKDCPSYVFFDGYRS